MKKKLFLQVAEKGLGVALQLLFPRRCPVCHEIVTPFGEKICTPCRKRVKYITEPYCMKCGKQVEEGEMLCKDCRRYPHAFVHGRALYEYSCMAPAIYRFKYGGCREYAEFWGEETERYLGEYIRSTGAQALIPVPLHPNRQRKRGYNQATLLARAMGKHLNMEVRTDYVCRIRDTAPLKNLTAKERQNNLKKAFIIKQNDVKLKLVMLVDDIYTTGSTMDGVAEALLAGGVERVYFVTLACGAPV